ncbi:MAG: redoxin domain-containing protein [Deltaproteobacteria bacterium]|nr:redoxin domain-containing protein [Deltaproteobacteria bacterium]
MKVFAIIVLIVGIGLIYFFLTPYLSPEKYSIRNEYEGTDRFQAVQGQGKSGQGDLKEAKKEEADKTAGEEEDAPFCDFRYIKDKGQKITIPRNAKAIRKEEKAGAPQQGWVWINIWAAWCKPCKKEIPLISNFIKNFDAREGALSLIYLSVDDDERELNKFISDSKIQAGSIFWLTDDETRTYWYRSVGLEYPVTLPVQIFLDSKSKVRCVRIGTVSERDLDSIVKMMQEG